MPEDQNPTAPETSINPTSPPTSDTNIPPLETVPASQPIVAPPVGNNKKKKLVLLGLIITVVAIVAGSSAGAYFGVIAPNKPENVLKTAVKKALEQRQATSKGNISVDMNAEDAELKNVTINFTAAADLDKQAFETTIDASASGVKLPLEIRGVEKNIYFKVGDLGSVKSVANLADPEVGALIDVVGKKISNQWIEVDESLLKQAGTECTTSMFSGFTKKDTDQLMELYEKNQFMTVKSKSADKVEGKDTTRFELGLDKQKAEAFGNNLDSVETLKKIKECSKTGDDNNAGGDTEVKDAVDKTEVSFIVWVDKSKTLRQIQIKANDPESKTSATATVTYTDGKVDVKKPEGAKPLLEVFGDFSELFGGGGSSDLGGEDQALFQRCSAAFEAFSNSNGASAIPAECQ